MLQIRLATYVADARSGLLAEARDIKAEFGIDAASSSLQFTMPGTHRIDDGYAVVPTEGRYIFQKVDVALEVSWGGSWVEPPNCRFQISSEQMDPETGEITLTGRGIAHDLTGAINNSGSYRNKETLAHDYHSVGVGRAMESFFDSAKSSGYMPYITRSWNGTSDSEGVAWNQNTWVSLPFEATMLDMLDIEEPYVDWEMRKNDLFAVKKGNLWKTVEDVCLVDGADLIGLPRSLSLSDDVQRLVARGEDGMLAIVNSTKHGTTRGPRARTVHYPGVKNKEDLIARANADLRKMEAFTSELMRDMSLATANFLPFRDFNIGDVVWVESDYGTRKQLQVSYVTLVHDDDEQGLRVALWFGDKVATSEKRMARRIKQLSGSSVTSGVQGPIQSGVIRQGNPAAPTGLTANSSLTYDAGGYAEATLNVGWNAVTTVADGEPMQRDVAHYVVEGRLSGAASYEPWGNVYSNSFTRARLRSGTAYQVRVRAVDTGGAMGGWSSITHTTEKDTVPPPVPTKPILTSHLGVVTIVWDGVLQGPVPADFRRVEVSLQGKPVGNLTDAGEFLAAAEPKATVTATIRSVDTSGNKSDWVQSDPHTVASALDDVDIAGELSDVRDEIDAAWELADEAQTAAGTAQTTADGKNTIYTETFDPAYWVGKNGDLWRKVNEEGAAVGEWTRISGVWTPTPITSERITNLDVGKLTVTGPADFNSAFINHLVANNAFISQLTTEKLMIGDRSNLIDNPVPKDGTGWAGLYYSSTEGGYIWASNSGSEVTGNRLPLREGQRIAVSMECYSSSAARSVGIRLVEVTEAGEVKSGGSTITVRTAATLGAGSTWETLASEVDVEATGLYRLEFTLGTQSTLSVHFRNLSVGSAMHGTRIQDGTLSTDKLLVKNGWIETLVTSQFIADHIEAGAIKAIMIDSKAITADKLHADAITTQHLTGKTLTGATIIGTSTITGATVRTSSGTSRLEMAGTTFRSYSGGTVRFSLGVDGAQTFWGPNSYNAGGITPHSGGLSISAPGGELNLMSTSGSAGSSSVSIWPNAVEIRSNGSVTVNNRDIGWDSGWVKMDLYASWSHVSYFDVQVRKVNGTIFMKGLANLTAGHNFENTVTTLPVAFRPESGSVMLQPSVASGNKAVVTCHVTSAGVVSHALSRSTGAPTGYVGFYGSWPAVN